MITKNSAGQLNLYSVNSGYFKDGYKGISQDITQPTGSMVVTPEIKREISPVIIGLGIAGLIIAGIFFMVKK